jgi:hypothetical protein
MKRKILIVLMFLTLFVSLGLTYAWYRTEVESVVVQVPKIDVVLQGNSQTTGELVPAGYAWFTNQTESYVFIYHITSTGGNFKVSLYDIVSGEVTANIVSEEVITSADPLVDLDLFEEYLEFNYVYTVDLSQPDTLIVTITVTLKNPADNTSLSQAQVIAAINGLKNKSVNIGFIFKLA